MIGGLQRPGKKESVPAVSWVHPREDERRAAEPPYPYPSPSFEIRYVYVNIYIYICVFLFYFPTYARQLSRQVIISKITNYRREFVVIGPIGDELKVGLIVCDLQALISPVDHFLPFFPFFLLGGGGRLLFYTAGSSRIGRVLGVGRQVPFDSLIG